MYNSNDHALAEKARRRIAFKIHLTVFLILISANWIIWALTDRSYLWPVWPTLGWGIGIIFHYIGVYKRDSFFSLEKEIEKLRE